MDVLDLIDGPHRTSWAVAWVPAGPNQREIAREVSPLTYVRSGLPPVLTIHGGEDPVVPYQQAVRFHAALTKAGVPNQLFTIPGGKHGGYAPEQFVQIFGVIRAFLATHHLTVPESAPVMSGATHY
jgi:dipeptidyl aminopeptidase/acylaminoacyl peptidase